MTERLSRNGARALQDASYKAFSEGHGFRAHWGFTFRPEARERLGRGEFTIGSEMRRTIDALQKWNERHGKGRLHYEWVVENPLNARGERNPHVHMNVDYVCRRRDFKDYAELVETVWGHGMVHMERIKDARAAAAYLLKCVGYVSKGIQSGQGPVIGNRYGISAALRPARSSDVLFVEEDGGRFYDGLNELCRLPGSVQYRHYGRGVFATRFGVGTHPWSKVTLDELLETIARDGIRLFNEEADLSECRSDPL